VGFEVREGEILCLLGPSGCGKTTLLRIVAGLEQGDGGQVLLKGVDLDGTPVHKRGIGFMFQEYALFPHKDVYGNVAFGLRMARLPRAEVTSRVREALERVGLAGFERRAVHELSGGEQQRVALARSLAPRPCLLLLDEPLGSLDRALREQLTDELRRTLKAIGLTALYVTHDQGEAFALGDRVAIMRQGRIEQIGPPEAVYQHPANPFVARFLGLNNLLPGEIVDAANGLVKTALGELQVSPLPTPHSLLPTPYSLLPTTVLLRPEAARLAHETGKAVNLIRGQVIECSFRGAHYRLVVRHSSGTKLAFHLAQGRIPSVGDEVRLSLRPQAINLLSAQTPI
jgi:ABC-type Fe3+/spermidine/putrescine transport system ATPase subunit